MHFLSYNLARSGFFWPSKRPFEDVVVFDVYAEDD